MLRTSGIPGYHHQSRDHHHHRQNLHLVVIVCLIIFSLPVSPLPLSSRPRFVTKTLQIIINCPCYLHCHHYSKCQHQHLLHDDHRRWPSPSPNHHHHHHHHRHLLRNCENPTTSSTKGTSQREEPTPSSSSPPTQHHQQHHHHGYNRRRQNRRENTETEVRESEIYMCVYIYIFTIYKAGEEDREKGLQGQESRVQSFLAKLTIYQHPPPPTPTTLCYTLNTHC